MDENNKILEMKQRDAKEHDEQLLTNDYTEETAAEVTPPIRDRATNRSSADDRRKQREYEETAEADNYVRSTAGFGIGTFAIILSVLSLFFMPIFLSVSGIVLGVLARFAGSRTFGNWAIGIGVLSLVLTLFFSPFF